MDERLERAMEQANYSLTIQTQKKNFQLRFQNSCVYATNGGTFVVSQHLISFVNTLISQGSNTAVLIDERGNPILITDLQAFIITCLGIYHEATNELYVNMETLRKARTTKSAVGL